jgi:hypothetical protein
MAISIVMMNLRMRHQSRTILTLMRKMIENQVEYLKQMISMKEKMTSKILIMTLINLLQKMISS